MADLILGPGGVSWAVPEPRVETPNRLREMTDAVLSKCRGEGPSNCVARCPLHVDARGYVQLAKKGNYREALQLIRQKLPFPGILGYVCAHPCELHCKRVDTDAAIRVRDVKRFLADWEPGDPQHDLRGSAQQGRSVAVVGSGPAGLMAAHDVRLAGYRVTLIDKHSEIGGSLVQKIPEYRLPRKVLERELTIVDALAITVELDVEVGSDVTLTELIRRHAAVILLPGYGGALQLLRQSSSGFQRTIRGTLGANPVTCEVGLEGVFAGGDAVSGPATVVHAMAMGRRAAESAVRYLRGQDLKANRESVLPSPLLWQLDISEEDRRRRERAPVLLKPFPPAMTESEMQAETERCEDCVCGLCVDDCDFLNKYCQSPKELARQIDGGIEKHLKMIYSCNVCELCSTVCPVDLDTGTMLREARRAAVADGLGPLPESRRVVKFFRAGISSTYALAIPEPGRQRSKRLFFTGCSLPAVAPKNTAMVYEELRRAFPRTGIFMYCCGAPVEALGMEEVVAEVRREIYDTAERLGAEQLVVACPDCQFTLEAAVPELEITSVWELLAECWTPPRQCEGLKVTIHDACKARNYPEVLDSIRVLVGKSGAVVDEMEYSRGLTRCCGSGGMIHPVDPPLWRRIARRRARESKLPMVTYCGGCRKTLRSAGKDAVHLLDLILGEDARARARARAGGTIVGYLNRFRTKRAFKRLRPLEVPE